MTENNVFGPVRSVLCSVQCFINIADLLNSGLTPGARNIKVDYRAIGHVACEKFAAKVQTGVRSLPLRHRLAHGSFSCGQFQVSVSKTIFDLGCLGLLLISVVVNSD